MLSKISLHLLKKLTPNQTCKAYSHGMKRDSLILGLLSVAWEDLSAFVADLRMHGVSQISNYMAYVCIYIGRSHTVATFW